MKHCCSSQITLAGLAAMLSLACGGQVKTDRDLLYELLTTDTVQTEHQCEFDLPRFAADLPEDVKRFLRRSVDAADISDVRACLLQVEEYNLCYANLDCEAFTPSTYPAWLLGDNSAPCGCGVTQLSAESSGPLSALLPDTLHACVAVSIAFLPIGYPLPSDPICAE